MQIKQKYFQLDPSKICSIDAIILKLGTNIPYPNLHWGRIILGSRHESKIADVSIFLENCDISVFFILAIYILYIGSFWKCFMNYLRHCIHQRTIVAGQENWKKVKIMLMSALFLIFFWKVYNENISTDNKNVSK